MVRLFLSPAKGNAGGRYFPHHGYLGLTPVRIDGVVRTRLDDDAKPVHATSLAVHIRCYESRITRTGAHRSRILVDYAKTLWRCPAHALYGLLADLDAPFRIVLPANVPGFSSANYQEYRTFWRVEAVLEHVPIPVVGARILRYYDLSLVRYDLPSPASPSSPSTPDHPHTLYVPASKPPAPIIHYSLSTPVLPVGPSDLILTSIFLRPLDPTLSIRSASVLVDRRIDLFHIANTSHFTPPADDADSPPTPLASLLPSRAFFRPSSPPQPIALSASMPEASSAAHPRSPYTHSPHHSSSTLAVDASASSYSVSSTSPLLPPRPPSPTPPLPATPTSDMPSRTITTTIIYADSGTNGGAFAYDPATGFWNKTINLAWPKTRSQNLWAMGESVRSELAEVTFWVKVKVIVSSPTHGTFTLDLQPRELTVVSTNDSERRLALAKYAEQKEASERSKSKSKSPGRRRTRESDGDGERERGSDKEAAGTGTASPTEPTPKPHRPRAVPPPIPSLPIRMSSASAAPSSSRAHPSPVISTTSTPSPYPGPPPRSMASPTSPTSPSFSSVTTATHRISTDTSASSKMTAARSSTSSRSSRRPHTSAGPRDKSNLAAGFARDSSDSGRLATGRSVDPSSTDSAPRFSSSRHPSSATSPPYPHTHTPTTYTHTHVIPLDHEKEKEDLIRAWEEELQRIENASRRSSAGMLAFFGGAGRKLRGRIGGTGTREGEVGVGAG